MNIKRVTFLILLTASFLLMTGVSYAAVKPEVFLNTDKSTITSGDSIKLSWSVRNTPDRCWASESWSGDKTIPANNAWNSETLTPSGTGTKRFSFTCSNSAGNSNTASVNVVVQIISGLNVHGLNTISKIVGESYRVNWGSIHVADCKIKENDVVIADCAAGWPAVYNFKIFTSKPIGTYNYTIGPKEGPVDKLAIVKVVTSGGGNGGGGGGPLKPQCNDGLDNDGDEKIDHPADLGCDSSNDNDERDGVSSPLCGDGICNGSENSSSCPSDCVVGLKPQCDDGKDNDSDGETDMDDPGCSSQDDNNEIDIGGGPPPGPPVINDFWAENNSGFSSCTIDASPKLLVIPKNTSKLTWSCDRIIIGCTLNDNNPKVPDTGAVDSSGSLNTPPINATTTFTLKCPGVGSIPPVTIRLFSPFLKEIIPQ